MAMIVTTTLIPKGFWAITLWPFIFVLSEHRNDAALIEHELVHYREQAWIAPIWWALYLLSKSFRWEREVKAYKVQIELGGLSVDRASQLLTTYRTGHTLDEARQALEQSA